MKYQYRNEYVESKSPLNCKTGILKSNWEELKSISWLTQRECQICSSLSTDMISLLSALLLGLWIKKTPHFLSQSSPFLLWWRCFFFCFFFAAITVLFCRYSTTTPNWLQPVLFFQRTEEWAVLISALPEVILECKREEFSYFYLSQEITICSISNQLHQWTNRPRFQWIVPCTFMHSHPRSNS